MNISGATRITQLAWGSIEVTVGGQALRFKDCKVWPGGARAWDWTETGTEHEPGIQPADIEEILARGVEVIVLGRGVFSRLGICPETEELLHARGVTCHSEDTKKAVEHFNQLVIQGKRAGGLFHTTC